MRVNLARLFSYTLEIERQRDEKAERIRSLEEDVRKLTDAALTSRGGKPAFRDSPPPKEMSVEGQYTPPGHPSRRPAVAAVPPLAPEEMSQLDQFKQG